MYEVQTFFCGCEVTAVQGCSFEACCPGVFVIPLVDDCGNKLDWDRHEYGLVLRRQITQDVEPVELTLKVSDGSGDDLWRGDIRGTFAAGAPFCRIAGEIHADIYRPGMYTIAVADLDGRTLAEYWLQVCDSPPAWLLDGTATNHAFSVGKTG